jgi:hypothetical protein
MNKAEATAITQRIRKAVDDTFDLLRKAYDGKAWKVLGYASWEAYVKAEFALSRSRSYQLLDQSRVIEAVKEAAGKVSNTLDISARDVEAVKSDLPAVTSEIKSRIDAGQKPATAVAETVKAKRAEKAGKKPAKVSKSDTPSGEAASEKPAEPDHPDYHDQQAAALPQFVKDHQQANADRREKSKARLTPEERVADLEQEVAALTGEIGALKEENARFDDMRVQYEQGGFDKVIAGKDEEIRVLKARLAQESEDKAGWMRKAKSWQKRAQELGWSGDALIQIEGTDDEVIHLD